MYVYVSNKSDNYIVPICIFVLWTNFVTVLIHLCTNDITAPTCLLRKECDDLDMQFAQRFFIL